MDETENIEISHLVNVLLTRPVYNEETIYLTIMNPSKKVYFSKVSKLPPELEEKEE